MVVNAPVASIEPTPPPSSIEAPPHVEAEQIEREQAQAQAQAQNEEQDHVVVVAGDEDVEEDETRKPVSFKASKIATGLGWLLFSTVVLANSVSRRSSLASCLEPKADRTSCFVPVRYRDPCYGWCRVA